VNEIHCWAWLGNLIPGWPDRQDDGEHGFEDLRSIIPPDPPEEEPDSEPENVCSPTSSREDCNAFGGKYNENSKECDCP